MNAASRCRVFGSPRRAARPRLEPLEPRLPLAAAAGLAQAAAGDATRVAVVDQTLVVEGTAGPDRIRIEPTRLARTVRVVADGQELGRFGPVAALAVDAGAGGDTVAVDPRLTLPAALDGGAGNDRLRAGFAPTALLGRNGNDVLVGVPGRDVFDDGTGQDRRVVLPTLGVIQVGPSVSAAARRSLSTSYTLRPLQVAGPAVVGPADLRDAAIVDLLRSNHDGGQPVALANATAETATTLAGILGNPAQVRLPGDRRAELVSFRKADQGGRTVFSTSILPPTAHVRVAPADRRAGRQLDAQGVNTHLQQVFSATPAVPVQPTVGESPLNLLALADAYVLTANYHDDSGVQIQVTTTAYSVRSFTHSADYYYFDQSVLARAGTVPLGFVFGDNQIPAL